MPSNSHYRRLSRGGGTTGGLLSGGGGGVSVAGLRSSSSSAAAAAASRLTSHAAWGNEVAHVTVLSYNQIFLLLAAAFSALALLSSLGSASYSTSDAEAGTGLYVGSDGTARVAAADDGGAAAGAAGRGAGAGGGGWFGSRLGAGRGSSRAPNAIRAPCDPLRHVRGYPVALTSGFAAAASGAAGTSAASGTRDGLGGGGSGAGAAGGFGAAPWPPPLEASELSLTTWRSFSSECPSGALLPKLLSTLPSSPFYDLLPSSATLHDLIVSRVHVAGRPSKGQDGAKKDRGSSSASRSSSSGRSDGRRKSKLPNAGAGSLLDLDPAEYLSNRTVLLVGDDVDRELLYHFCRIVGKRPVRVDARHPWGKSTLARIAKDHRPYSDSDHTADTALLANYCYVDEYDFMITHVQHYGVQDEPSTTLLPASANVDNLPIRFEERVTDLFAPYMRSLKSPLAHGGGGAGGGKAKDKAKGGAAQGGNRPSQGGADATISGEDAGPTPDLPPARPTSAPELVLVSTPVEDLLLMGNVLGMRPTSQRLAATNAAAAGKPPASWTASSGDSSLSSSLDAGTDAAAAAALAAAPSGASFQSQAETERYLDATLRSRYAEMLESVRKEWHERSGARRGGEGRRIRWRGLPQLLGVEGVASPVLINAINAVTSTLLASDSPASSLTKGSSSGPAAAKAKKGSAAAAAALGMGGVEGVMRFGWEDWARGTPSRATTRAAQMFAATGGRAAQPRQHGGATATDDPRNFAPSRQDASEASLGDEGGQLEEAKGTTPRAADGNSHVELDGEGRPRAFNAHNLPLPIPGKGPQRIMPAIFSGPLHATPQNDMNAVLGGMDGSPDDQPDDGGAAGVGSGDDGGAVVPPASPFEGGQGSGESLAGSGVADGAALDGTKRDWPHLEDVRRRQVAGASSSSSSPLQLRDYFTPTINVGGALWAEAVLWELLGI